MRFKEVEVACDMTRTQEYLTTLQRRALYLVVLQVAPGWAQGLTLNRLAFESELLPSTQTPPREPASLLSGSSLCADLASHPWASGQVLEPL